jgi:hypothetical protein
MKNQALSSKHCISYAPGHNVHWIQARVKYSEPRYDAAIEITSETTLEIRYLDHVEIFHNHNALSIQENLKEAVLDYVKFSPTSSLLYIQTEEPGGLHRGVFALHYLCFGKLTSCLIE